MRDLDHGMDLPGTPEDLAYQAKLLSRFFPSLAVQLRTALSDLYLAADALVPEDARDFDPELDRNLAVLDLNYYRLLRLAGNLSAAADLGEPLDPPGEDRDIVAETELVCRETESLARLLGLTLRFRCRKSSGSLFKIRQNSTKILPFAAAFAMMPCMGSISTANPALEAGSYQYARPRPQGKESAG